MAFDTLCRKQPTSLSLQALSHFSASVCNSWSNSPVSAMFQVVKDYSLAAFLLKLYTVPASTFQNLLGVQREERVKGE